MSKDDIEVRFTQYRPGGEQVHVRGEFAATDVHKQYGICLRTPPYVDKTITQPVHVSGFHKPGSVRKMNKLEIPALFPPPCNFDLNTKCLCLLFQCSMYLYKPKEKAQSDPVDFWYLPAAAEVKVELNNGGLAAAATAASPIAHAQQMSLQAQTPPDIKPIKRGRPPKSTPDEISDGETLNLFSLVCTENYFYGLLQAKLTCRPSPPRTGAADRW